MRGLSRALLKGVNADLKLHVDAEVAFFRQKLNDIAFDDRKVDRPLVGAELAHINLHGSGDDCGVCRNLAFVKGAAFSSRFYVVEQSRHVWQGLAQQIQRVRCFGELFIRQVAAVGAVVGDGLVLLPQRLSQLQSLLGIDAVLLAHVHLQVQQRER